MYFQVHEDTGVIDSPEKVGTGQALFSKIATFVHYIPKPISNILSASSNTR